MSDKPHPDSGGEKPSAYSQEFQQAHVSARVPEKVARGVFSTGALILQGPTEFVIDFVLRMNQPQQVSARVILPVPLMPRFIDALRDNLEKYRESFGPPPALPQMPPPAKPPSIEDIYSQLKVHEDVMCGTYANQVMVAHTAAEFCFDFITTFYPRNAVSARVFLSAAQVPVLLTTLNQSWQNYLAKSQQPPR